MTALELYRNVLTEINKQGAPSLLLEEFIYLANKAVQQYTNKGYNKYDKNQQASDDLRVLKTSDVLPINIAEPITPAESARYYVILPADYMHMLSCVVEFEGDDGSRNKRCNKDDKGGKFYTPARRMTADMYPTLLTNAYFKPSHKNPYYFLNNVNDSTSEVLPSNSTMDSLIKSLRNSGERPVEGRQSNVSKVLLEIRCGDSAVPTRVFVDYLKSPMRIVLTDAEINRVGGDISQVLEFPDVVCYEIVNEIVKLVLENASDPRLQTNLPINMTIPTGEEGKAAK